MSPISRVSPDVVRALVRQALEERLGIRPSAAAASSQPTRLDHLAHPAHPSLSLIAHGEECSDDIDLPIRKPCLIEPHRPCYNSGYCRQLGH